MTTKQLSKEYRELANKSSGLWYGAYLHVVWILERYTRARAVARLLAEAKRCEKMSISCVYKCAANTLESKR